jgi:uncharacterized protein (TIRG00374 family)
MGHERPSRAGRTIRLVRALLFPAIVAAVFVGILPRIADLDRVWAAISSMSWSEYAVLGVLTVWNVVTYWPMLVAAMPGLSLWQAAVVCQSSTSVAMTLPGGGAIAVGVSYAMYTSWGFAPAAVATSAFMTFVANMSFKLILPVVSLGFLALHAHANVGVLSTAVLGVSVMVVMIAILAVALRSEGFARRIGRWSGNVVSYLRRLFGRSPVLAWDSAALRLRSRMVTVVRERWLYLAVAEVVSQLSVFMVLLASVRFVGVSVREVSSAEVLAVFAFVRLATAMPVIPGNVGLAELSYIGGLVLSGAPRTGAVAAVLLFRFLTYFVQIPLGGLTYLVWRRRSAWRKPLPASDGREPPGHAVQVDEREAREREPGLVQDGADGGHQQPAVPSSQ